MTEPIQALTNAGLDVRFVKLNTDTGIADNAAFIRGFITRIAAQRGEEEESEKARRRLVLIGHSKGVVDAAAAISFYPEEVGSRIAALVSLQVLSVPIPNLSSPHPNSALP